jgi:hypothetical protein
MFARMSLGAFSSFRWVGTDLIAVMRDKASKVDRAGTLATSGAHRVVLAMCTTTDIVEVRICVGVCATAGTDPMS